MKLTLLEAREQGQSEIWDASLAIERSPVRAVESTVLEFGRFRVLLPQRQLLARGVPIELGTRAFDVLMVLLDADGSLVTKDELIKRAWGIVVAPENLKVQICALRNALGEDRDLIRTEFGRGYRFTAAVRRSIATDPGRLSWSDVKETPARREAALTMELAAIATRLAELEEKLAAQHNAARFGRHRYCARSPGHADRPKHAERRRLSR